VATDLSFRALRLAVGSTQSFIHCVAMGRGLFHSVIWQGGGDDQLLSPRYEIKNKWSCAYIPTYAFAVCIGAVVDDWPYQGSGG